MLIRAIQSEKALGQIAKKTYMFVVPLGASKQAIKDQIEKEHKVTVTSIRVLIRKGKATRFSRGKRAYPGTTHRQDRRVAYATLKDGDSIKVFDEEPVTETKAADAETKTTIKAADAQPDEQTKKAGLFTKRRTGNRGDK